MARKTKLKTAEQFAIKAGVVRARRWFANKPKCCGEIYLKKHFKKKCIRAMCEYFKLCMKESGFSEEGYRL